MKIALLDVDDVATVEALVTLLLNAHAVDYPDNPPPVPVQVHASLRQVHPEYRLECLTARADGRLVAAALLVLPDTDNRHLAEFELHVDPDHRRREVGSALLDRVVRRARKEDRRTLIAAATGPVPGGPPRSDAPAAFLTRHGFTAALPNTRRRIDLTAIDEADERALLAESSRLAADYDCASWFGVTPDPYAADVARLTNRVITDAPRGDVDLTELTLDGARLQDDERYQVRRQMQPVGTAARHRPTGAVAAFTGIHVRGPADHASVSVTIVDPAHRGHRLGTIVKILCHQVTRRAYPSLRYVITGNADANAHMVAINERLGFVGFEQSTVYQLTL